MIYAILGPRRASGVAYNLDKLTNHPCNNATPGGPPLWSWTDATRLDELGPAAIDSLDLLSLSAATAELLPDGGLGPGLMQARCFGAWCDAVAGSVRHPPQHVTFRSSRSIRRCRFHSHPADHVRAAGSVRPGV